MNSLTGISTECNSGSVEQWFSFENHCFNNLFLLRACDAKVVYFAPIYMQLNWTVMYSTLCTLQLSQAERQASEQLKTRTPQHRGRIPPQLAVHGSGLRQTSVECIKISNWANYRRETQPLVSLSSAHFWSAVDDCGLFPSSYCRRDWLSLVQGRGCRELQRQ